jgi:hypothetical protein
LVSVNAVPRYGTRHGPGLLSSAEHCRADYHVPLVCYAWPRFPPPNAGSRAQCAVPSMC